MQVLYRFAHWFRQAHVLPRVPQLATQLLNIGSHAVQGIGTAAFCLAESGEVVTNAAARTSIMMKRQTSRRLSISFSFIVSRLSR